MSTATPTQVSVFEKRTIENAPEETREALKNAKEKNGFVPNLYSVLANSPAALKTYLSAIDNFRKHSGFNQVEQEVILLTISYENECHYCMAAHSAIGHMNDVPSDVINALRNGNELTDSKLNTLSKFTRTLVVKRGWPSEAAIEKFLDAGYSEKHILGILTAISAKTLSNYTNHIAQTPLDEPFKKFEWSK